MFRLSIFVAIPSRQVFAIAILNVIWLSTTLVESSFLECLLAASKTKKPAPRQQDDKTKKWLNPNPNTTQNSSGKLYFDLLVVIPAHAKNDIERRVAQRESWQMLLQSNGSCLSCGSARSVRVIYVVGSETNEALAEEIEKYGDIVVLEGFSQNYYKDRARKTRLSIRTAVENFDFGLLMKTGHRLFYFLGSSAATSGAKKTCFGSDLNWMQLMDQTVTVRRILMVMVVFRSMQVTSAVRRLHPSQQQVTSGRIRFTRM